MNYMIMSRERFEHGRRSGVYKALLYLDLLVVTDEKEFTVVKNRLGPVGVYPSAFLPYFLATNVGKDFAPHDTRMAA